MKPSARYFRGSISMAFLVAKKYRKLIPLSLLSLAIMGCGGEDSGQSAVEGGSNNDAQDSHSPGHNGINAKLSTTPWAFDGGSALMVSTAKLAGSYSVADSESLEVEIRDVYQQLKHIISASDITGLLPDMDLLHASALCGMTLTPSGRFLYLAICDADAGQQEDAILAYNTSTEVLTVFHRLYLQDTKPKGLVNVGMNYYSSSLYVGAESAVYQIEADRNAAFEVANHGRELITKKIGINGFVQDIAVDIEKGSLYLKTPQPVIQNAAWRAVSRADLQSRKLISYRV